MDNGESWCFRGSGLGSVLLRAGTVQGPSSWWPALCGERAAFSFNKRFIDIYSQHPIIVGSDRDEEQHVFCHVPPLHVWLCPLTLGPGEWGRMGGSRLPI